MGQPAARVGDMHVCPMFDGPKPHVGGPVLPPGKPTVLIGGLPAATITDRCVCASAPDIIVQGAQTVLINGMMAARLGDMTVHGGRIVVGCPTVLIGGPTFTSPSFIAKFLNVFLDNIKFNAGIVVGFGEGLWATIEGLYNVLTHPIDTIKGIFQLADSVITTLARKETWIALTQKETWDRIKSGLGQIYDDFERASPYEKGKVVGHATEFIAELLVPVSKAKLATEAAEAVKIAEATRAAAGVVEVTEAARAAEFARLGRATQIDNKILKGEQVGNTLGTADFRTIRGAHSPTIRSDPNFNIISETSNADGTSVVKFTKKVDDGPPPIYSKPKTSTVAPAGWSEGKILQAGDEVAQSPALATRARDGATLHRQTIDGVEWEVIKDSSGNITSSYPTGGGGGTDANAFTNQ